MTYRAFGHLLYSAITKFFGVYRNHPVRLSICLSKFLLSATVTHLYLILMKLYIVVVYNLRMCMKVENPSPNIFKGDNKYVVQDMGVPFCDVNNSSLNC